MKQLAEIAKDKGYSLATTEGGAHTKISFGSHVDVVPRHTEINELTAQAIIKRAKEAR